MEQRKLIQFGTNSFVVSIPKKWLSRNNLGKGDPLYIQDLGSSLNIRSNIGKPTADQREIHIDGTEHIESIKLRILTAYINNIRRIIIMNPQEQSGAIRSILHGVIALEIVEQTPQVIVAQDYLDMHQISVKELFRQVDVILRSMLADINHALTEPASPRRSRIGADLTARDQDINRLVVLALRTITYRLRNLEEHDPAHLLKQWEAFYTLEKTGDEVKRIGRLITQADLTAKQDIMYILKDIEELYTEIMEIHYLSDKEAAYRLAAKKAQRMERLQHL
ncbi:MAG: hypothetical protein HC945_02380, partial [Nitrosarchaeum sp.]|nr:hypothetical protein [Nitrosarchaeum sp.]